MDEDLRPYVRMIKEGDEQAFQYVYNRTKEAVYRTVYLLAGDRADVCDTVSEIYWQMIRSLDKYDDNKPFRSWLNGLIVRQVHNANRKLWRRLRIAEKNRNTEIERYADTPELDTIAAEQRREVAGWLGKLSVKLRTVIVLRYYQDMTLQDIADTLGIPLGTVKSRHDLAIRKLRVLSGADHFEKEASVHVY